MSPKEALVVAFGFGAGIWFTILWIIAGISTLLAALLLWLDRLP